MQVVSTVQIVAVPPGEAPLRVREKWVGLELPVIGYPAPAKFIVYGALTQPRSMLAQWWGLVRGRAEKVSGYVVEASAAMDILAMSSPEAASWWRENTPHLIGPRLLSGV